MLFRESSLRLHTYSTDIYRIRYLGMGVLGSMLIMHDEMGLKGIFWQRVNVLIIWSIVIAQ